MSINSIHPSRISNQLRASNVLDSLRHNTNDLAWQQLRVATGRSFVTPSDDPIAAAQSTALRQILERHDQVLSNLRYADSYLQATDAALLDVNDLLIEASAIASQNVGTISSAEEREASAEVIAEIIDQLVNVGNRQFDGRYLFAGRDTTQAPFVDALGGVAFIGDSGDLLARVAALQEEPVNFSGDEVFSALSSEVQGAVDLDPALTEDTRLEDLSGAQGQGVEQGILVFEEEGGLRWEVNLADADTLGDVIDRINSVALESGSGLTATLGIHGLTLAPGSAAITVTDTSNGLTAGGWGILTETSTSATIQGLDLGRRLTGGTRLDDLMAAEGLDLSTPIQLTNGGQTAEIDLSAALTIQDLFNTINNSGLYVYASIDESGQSINVVNQVSGVSLSIGEMGGATASSLGIRTLATDTPLAGLPGFEEMGTDVADPVFQITAKDGSVVEVSLEGAATIGDVIDAINTAAQEVDVNVSASLAETGNGIRLEDETGGTGSLTVAPLNQSFAASDLGLEKSVADPATELIGDDPNPVRVDSVFTALYDLHAALIDNDSAAITSAGERLDEFTSDLTRMRGVVGARSKSMQDRLARTESALFTSEAALSATQDLDFNEAVTRLSQTETALQATMLTGARLMNISLLDYLA